MGTWGILLTRHSLKALEKDGMEVTTGQERAASAVLLLSLG